MDIGLEIQKTNVGIRVSIFEIPCIYANYQVKRATLSFSAQIYPKMDFVVVISKI